MAYSSERLDFYGLIVWTTNYLSTLSQPLGVLMIPINIQDMASTSELVASFKMAIVT